MSYRVRYTLPDGRTGLVTRQFTTREEAQEAIDRGLYDDALRYRLNAASLAYVVEEVSTPTWNEEPPRWMREIPRETIMDVSGESLRAFKAPQARIRELEAELAQLRVGYDVANREVAHLREAYDAARQDLDVAERNVARLESTLAMVQASWAVSVANAAVANTLSAEAHCKTVASMVRLDRAIELGDAMHAAHPSEEWAAYKESLAASRQGPAKASDAPGEGGDSGEGAK